MFFFFMHGLCLYFADLITAHHWALAGCSWWKWLFSIQAVTQEPVKSDNRVSAGGLPTSGSNTLISERVYIMTFLSVSQEISANWQKEREVRVRKRWKETPIFKGDLISIRLSNRIISQACINTLATPLYPSLIPFFSILSSFLSIVDRVWVHSSPYAAF